MRMRPWASDAGHHVGAVAGTVLFIVLSCAFLWLSGRVMPWVWVAVGGLSLGVGLLLPDRRWLVNADLLVWLAAAYLTAVLMSAGLHHLALRRLDPAAYITAARGTAYWGDAVLLRQTAVYLLFPVLLMVCVALFQNTANPLAQLKLLPLLLLPSLVVALYQALVDFRFWNRSTATWGDRVPGLGSDVNGFGITLFLLFSVSLSAMCSTTDRRVKMLYGGVLILICWALLASGSRTAFGGILLMLPVFFVLRQRMGGDCRRRGSIGVHGITVAAVLLIVLLAGAALLSSGGVRKIPLAKRLQHSLELIRREGDARRLSSRWELGLQAARMTALSPWAGWGPGGFWRQVDNVRTRYGERCGYIDNAENLYLQVAAELGVPMLGALVLFFLIPMKRCLRGGGGGQPLQRFTREMAIATLVVTMALSLTGPHIFSPEVAWIVCVLLGFVWVTGMENATRPPKRVRPAWMAAAVLVFMALFLFGTYSASLGKRGYAATEQASWWPLKNEYGLYFPWEDWGPPYGKMVWTSKKSSTRIRMRANGLSLTVFAPGATARPQNPLTVTLRVNGKLLDRLVFSEGGRRRLTYFLPGPRNREIFFQTEASRTFVPRKVGMGNDRRVLGIALSPIRQHRHVLKN